MGTSSSYGGPKGKNPLLPSDFNNNDNSSTNPDNQQDLEPENAEKNPETLLWQNAKTQISRLIKNPSRNTRSALSSYVKAHGGARKAASSATSGKSTTISLGGFLSSISSEGIRSTLRLYEINYKGRNVEEVLSELIVRLAPTPNTKENAVAVKALMYALEILYEEVAENGNDLDSLDNLNEKKFNEVMKTYISAYIYQRFLSELEFRFEKYAINTGSAIDIEENIKEYIDGVVDNKLKNQDFSTLDYSSGNVLKIINEIFIDCYNVIQGEL